MRCHPWILFRLAVLGTFVGATGCADAATGPIRAQAIGNSQVAVTNRSSEPIFVTVFGSSMVARTNWAPCVDGPTCRPIEGGETRLENFSSRDIHETHAAVYWWRAVRGADGLMKPDSIHVVRVRL